MTMWHSTKIEEVYDKLGTSEKGLTEKEASSRLLQYGKNELPKKKEDTIIKVFFKQMINPIIILLLFTVIVSIFLHEYIDAIAITFIVLVDLVLGTFQEYKANKAAAALAELISLKVKVIRDNKENLIDSKNLVVGDIVSLESGDKISADLRIIEAHNLLVDESVLTGESNAIAKHNILLDEKAILAERKNMLFTGTSVMSGRALAVVVETGVKTEVGKIADNTLNIKETKSPLTIRVEKFSKQICLILAVIAVIIAIVLLVKGFETSAIFSSVIALAVSAMPEGLPLALTMALTVSSNKMKKKNVIVKNLNSVESLGSCTIIASDKTGTLTVNEQTAKKILLPDNTEVDIEGIGYNGKGKIDFNIIANKNYVNEIAKLGVINNEAKQTEKDGEIEYFGDSIDVAFKYLGKKAFVEEDTKIVGRIPYESVNMFSSVFYEEGKDVYCTVKGSIEKVLTFCDTMKVKYKIVKIDKDSLMKQNEYLANLGYRVIAIAKGKVKDFENKDTYLKEDVPTSTFIGLVGFIDPVREDAIASVEKCKEAGIKVVMITGDHPKTAFAIAKELGIAVDEDEIISGQELSLYENKSDYEFDEAIKNKKVFARVTPTDKLRIVESFKRQGEFIAVTGDGVNDAPAIKAANIGIAMGSGTDVAKETASMIILDDKFSSIVSGIEEGRVAYANIRKVVYMLLSSGFAEISFFILAIIFDYPMPLVAIQLLWLNIVTDGLQDFALSFEKGEKGIMEEKPRSPKEPLFEKKLFTEVTLSGVSMGLMVFIAWIYLMDTTHHPLTQSRGYIMALMVFLQNFQVFNCCSETQSIFKRDFSTNWFILFTIISAIVLQILVSETSVLSMFFKIEPVPILDLIMLFIYSSLILVIMEIFKIFKRKKLKYNK